MVGRAGATRVRFNEAISDPNIRPANTARTARSTPFFSGAVVASRAATAVIGPRSPLAAGDATPPQQGLPSHAWTPPDPPAAAGPPPAGAGEWLPLPTQRTTEVPPP